MFDINLMLFVEFFRKILFCSKFQKHREKSFYCDNSIVIEYLLNKNLYKNKSKSL